MCKMCCGSVGCVRCVVEMWDVLGELWECGMCKVCCGRVGCVMWTVGGI